MPCKEGWKMTENMIFALGMVIGTCLGLGIGYALGKKDKEGVRK